MRKTCLPCNLRDWSSTAPVLGAYKEPWRTTLETHRNALRALRDLHLDAFRYRDESETLVGQLKVGLWFHRAARNGEAVKMYERALDEHYAHLEFCGVPVSDCDEESSDGR